MEKTMMDVKKLNEKLKELQKQVNDLQEQCKHTDKNIKVIGPNDIRWICKKCEKALGWPTPEELTKWAKS